jgi:hypothetical protein
MIVETHHRLNALNYRPHRLVPGMNHLPVASKHVDGAQLRVDWQAVEVKDGPLRVL